MYEQVKAARSVTIAREYNCTADLLKRGRCYYHIGNDVPVVNELSLRDGDRLQFRKLSDRSIADRHAGNE